MSSRNHFSPHEPDVKIAKGQRGTGQIREKAKEDEIGIVIADARSLSSKADEGGSEQVDKILHHETSAKQSAAGPRQKLYASDI